MKKRKFFIRFICLLICLITLAGYFPVQETEASAGENQYYWKWTRADTITDLSEANLNQYTRMLIMYKDNGEEYVLGPSYSTKKVNCSGYHSKSPFNGYSNFLSTTRQVYFSGTESSENYSPVKNWKGYQEYGKTVNRVGALVANTLSEAQAIDGNIQYGAKSFVTLEDVSCLQLSVVNAHTAEDLVWWRFRLYTDYSGEKKQIVSNGNWYQSLALAAVVDGEPKSGWHKYSVSKYWEFNYFKSKYSGHGRIYSHWMMPDVTGFCPTWNFADNSVFSELVNLDKYADHSRDFKLYVYFGSACEFTCLNDYTVKAGSVVNIAKNEQAFVMDRLTIEPGGVLTVDGVLVNNGSIDNYGTIMIRDGGTISDPIYDKDSSGGFLTCYGGCKEYSGTGSPGEGGLIIEKNGRLVCHNLILYKGSSVINDGEMIQLRIICSDGKSDFTMQQNGYVWLGYSYTNPGTKMDEKLAKVAERAEKISKTGAFYSKLSITDETNMTMPSGLNIKYEQIGQTKTDYTKHIFNKSNPM